MDGIITFPFKVRAPLKLQIYNLARPNIDSIIDAKILSKPKKVKRKTNLLSKKQFDRYIQSKRDFNSWLKRTGEAPVIFDEAKTEKTASNLNKYFAKRNIIMSSHTLASCIPPPNFRLDFSSYSTSRLLDYRPLPVCLSLSMVPTQSKKVIIRFCGLINLVIEQE